MYISQARRALSARCAALRRAAPRRADRAALCQHAVASARMTPRQRSVRRRDGATADRRDQRTASSRLTKARRAALRRAPPRSAALRRAAPARRRVGAHDAAAAARRSASQRCSVRSMRCSVRSSPAPDENASNAGLERSRARASDRRSLQGAINAGTKLEKLLRPRPAWNRRRTPHLSHNMTTRRGAAFSRKETRRAARVRCAARRRTSDAERGAWRGTTGAHREGCTIYHQSSRVHGMISSRRFVKVIDYAILVRLLYSPLRDTVRLL